MKAVIIDDNQQFSKLLCDQLSIIKGDSNAQPCEKKPLKFKEEKKPENGKTEIVNAVIDFAKHESRLIAQVIVEIYGLKNGNCEGKKDQLHIFINIEGKFGGASRQEQKGVEILMWLRCKHRVCNPVILYSFQSNAELLKKKPEHLIINSEGCYSYQLPLEIEKIKQRIEARSFRGVSNWEGLKKFLKPVFDIDKFRHREANWWGIKALWDVHKVIKKGAFNESYPEKVEERLCFLNSLIGDFCHSIGVTRLEEYIEQRKKQINDEIYVLDQQINEVTEPLEKLNQKKVVTQSDIEHFQSKITDLENNWLPYTYDDSQKNAIQNEINENVEYKVDAETEQSAITNEQAQISTQKQQLTLEVTSIKKRLNELHKEIKKELVSSSIPIINSDVKIMLIDDQAEEGWSDIYQYMIYDSANSKNFKVIEFDKSIGISQKVAFAIENIFSTVSKINNEGFIPDILFLDLRLFPSHDENKKSNISSMSGTLLLKMIKNKYPGLPIVITSASNKVGSYEELTKLGADAYWMKEGIDIEYRASETVSNYIKILRYCSVMMNEEYNLLRVLAKDYMELENSRNYWWNIKKWENGDATTAPQRIIEKIYADVTCYYRNLLRQKYCLETTYTMKNEWFIYSNIINHLGKVVECVHHLYSSDFRNSGNFSGIISDRKDVVGLKLYTIRNKASHLGKAQNLKFKDLNDFVVTMDQYLFKV